ncbi:hypothetical protein QBK99_05445 [Corticibacterium sp. UT-5YL-CI-8]|nr:hypothetical protein [Tianweitania sp. UT-5YL-CI-8]
MSPPWTRQPVRIFQHLLRESDAIGLDPAQLVAEAAAMGADTYLCMGGGFSAWYPTEIAAQPINPDLNVDLVGDVIVAAQKSSMRVIVRMDISKGRAGTQASHPDWFVRNADGSHATVWDMPQICPTGPFWQVTNFAILDELLSRYVIDGFFYNYFYIPRCYCPRCQQQVMDATGLPVPAPSERSPSYERWRQSSLAHYTARMRDFIRARRRDAVLVPYHHVRAGWDLAAMADASDLIGAQASNPIVPNPIDPQPMWNHWAAEEALVGRAVKPDAAPFLIQSTSGFFASRQTALPMGRLLHNLALTAAHGAGTAPAINGLLNQDDPRAIAPLRHFTQYLTHNAEWYRGLTSMAKLAIVRSEASVQWGVDAGKLRGRVGPSGHIDEFRGLFEISSALRHPIDVVVAGDLAHAGLKNYAAILCPAVSCLSDADAAALNDYVANGGTLLATGDFAAATEVGQLRATPGSAAVPALPSPRQSISGAYFALRADHLRNALDGIPHIGADGDFCPPASLDADWDIGLALIGPFANNAPEFTVVEGPGTAPAMLSRQHGTGTAIWLPWFLGSLYHRYAIADCAALLGAILARPLGPSPIITTASTAVDFTLYGHPAGAVVHAINGATAQNKPLIECTPLAGFAVEVALPAKRAVLLNTGEDLPMTHHNGPVRFTVPRLENFAAIALLYDGAR